MPRSLLSCSRTGVQRRPTSGADSVDSSAKVSSLGQLGSAANVVPTSSRTMRTADINARMQRMGTSWLDDGSANTGRDHVDAHDHDDDEQDDRGGLSVVEGPDGIPQIKADTAASHHADDRSGADVGF